MIHRPLEPTEVGSSHLGMTGFDVGNDPGQPGKLADPGSTPGISTYELLDNS